MIEFSIERKENFRAILIRFLGSIENYLPTVSSCSLNSTREKRERERGKKGKRLGIAGNDTNFLQWHADMANCQTNQLQLHCLSIVKNATRSSIPM